MRSASGQKVSISTLKDGSTSSSAATTGGFLHILTDQAYRHQETDRRVRLGTTSSTILQRSWLEMLEEQTMPEGKNNHHGCGFGSPWDSGCGGRNSHLVETREREGERKQREGAFLSLRRSKCCSQGSSGDLLPCQIYAAAEPSSVLAPLQITGRKPEPGEGGWGQSQCPRQEWELLETTGDSFSRDRPDSSLCPAAPVSTGCCCCPPSCPTGGDTDGMQKPLGTEQPSRRTLAGAPEGPRSVQ